MQQIEASLAQLTKQLNEIRPVSEKNVGDVQKEFSAQFEQRLTLQSSRIDTLSEAMEKSQKAAEDNTEMLQNLLIGIENMGDNLKQFREEMEGWKTTELQNAEREFEEAEQEMLTEVSLFVPAM